MKKVSIVFTALFLVIGMAEGFANSSYNQVFSADNADGKINAKSIENAFNASDMHVDVNNDMNSIFEKRYKKVHHKSYNLAIFTNTALVAKLMKKHPSIGLITPLSMSIFSDDKNRINVSTLSLKGMARITKIPETNPDLIKYAAMLDAALHKALPNGIYLTPKSSAKPSDKQLVTSFTTAFEPEDGETYVDLKDGFKEEFESEIATVGFLVPKSYTFETDDYDFFDTYSIIRFNVIFPVSKRHPDAGSYAPFSLAIYKKKGDDTVHVAYPSIDNWINDLGITDEESLKEINKTQGMISGILEELTE